MKQIIVVNESLKLPRGKLSAQVAHAAVGSFLSARPEVQRSWLKAGMPKVVLRGESEADLLQLEQRAVAAGLPVALIRDAGRTIVAPGTITCLGLGPAEDEEVDQFTGERALVK